MLWKGHSMDYLVKVEAVSRRFPLDHSYVSALDDASLHVSAGEFLAIAGPSGSGKSTLLNLMGCIDKPTAGRIVLDGQDTSALKPARLTALRREKIGFVFQAFNLIPVFTASENVEYPLLVQGVSASERGKRAAAALESVGLLSRARQRPDLLSGGERQRVAIARALANEPRLLLADEPTGAVDSVTSQRVLDLLADIRERRGMTVIVVSYDPQVGARADRMVTVTDGVLTQPETDLSAAPSA